MNTSLDTFTTVPTKTQSQYDYILLDGSGSMQEKWFDTLDAIETYVAGTRAANIHSQIILHTFDSLDLDCIQRNVAIESWKSLRDEPIGAHFASTPLYDAINAMGRRLRDLDPPRASILIVTDGYDNISQTSITQAKAILDWCRAKGWQITFIGAAFNNEKQAALLGANPASAIGVDQRHLTDATSALAKKRARYGLYGEDMHFSEGERQQFGGYLSAPEASEAGGAKDGERGEKL